MANDIGNAIESLPGWVIPATIGGVVLVALFSRNNSGGGGGGGYNTVVYGPAPVDPGLVSLQQSEIAAKQGVITTALNAFISRDIQSGENDRDVHLAAYSADVENRRTAAAEGVAIRQSSDQTKQILYQTQAATRITDSQGATQKYLAKEQAKSSIWGSVLGFGTSIAGLFF